MYYPGGKSSETLAGEGSLCCMINSYYSSTSYYIFEAKEASKLVRVASSSSKLLPFLRVQTNLEAEQDYLLSEVD